jgi:hypothetical protein
MLRKVIAVALVLLICPLCASASLASVLVGSWRVTAASSLNGELSVSEGTSKVSRYGTRGFYWISSVKSNGILGTSYLWMHDSGTCLGYVKNGTTTLAILQGSWSLKGNTLTYDVSANTLQVDYRQTASFKLVSSKGITTSSTTSFGAALSGEMTRN